MKGERLVVSAEKVMTVNKEGTWERRALEMCAPRKLQGYRPGEASPRRTGIYSVEIVATQAPVNEIQKKSDLNDSVEMFYGQLMARRHRVL